MALWFVIIAQVVISVQTALWGFSDVSRQLVEHQHEEGRTAMRILGVGALLCTLLTGFGWVAWSIETGDWRYVLLAVLPIVLAFLRTPLTVLRLRMARKQLTNVEYVERALLSAAYNHELLGDGARMRNHLEDLSNILRRTTTRDGNSMLDKVNR